MKSFVLCAMKYLSLFLISTIFFFKLHASDFYKLIVYHYADSTQEKHLDDFLSSVYLPKLHKNGFTTIGVFKPIANDTAKDKQILVLLNHEKLEKLSQPLQWGLQELGSYVQPIYTRYEQIFLCAFKEMPKMKVPSDAI